MKLERLQELNNTLTKVLADPQPGLFTWGIWLEDTMRTLCKEWHAQQPKSGELYLEAKRIAGRVPWRGPFGLPDAASMDRHEQAADDLYYGELETDIDCTKIPTNTLPKRGDIK